MERISLAVALAVGAALLLLSRVPLRYNFHNLTLRWKTTLLTALSFTLVIALLIVMLAFVNGMRRLTENSGRADNVLVLADGATDEAISNLSVGDLAEIEHQAGVRQLNGRPMTSRETYIVVNQPVRVGGAYFTQQRFLQVRGIDSPQMASAVHNLELHSGGRWFSASGVAQTTAEDDPSQSAGMVECVVGEGLARELAGDRPPAENRRARHPKRLDVGDTFQLANRTWLVVGILDSAGTIFNSEVWAKRSLVGQIFGKDTYTTLVLRAKSDAQARELQQSLAVYKRAAVAPQLETQYYDKLSETSQQFFVTAIVVVAVMSVGGIFGVMNTMFAAISQRVHDIGLLRVLGFSPHQILVSFLLESLAIALLGGLLGCGLGWMADGWSATSMVSGTTMTGKSVVLTLTVDAPTLAKGMLLALSMGFLGGLLPALNAMRIKPLAALR